MMTFFHRHPSVHFCGTTSDHKLPVVPHDLLHNQHHQYTLPSSNQFHQQNFQKSERDHLGGIDGEGLLESEGRNNHLRKRQAPDFTKNTCPMELVVAYSFVEVYGREGIADVVQYVVSCIVM